jgi:hypothetical protein
MKHYSKVIFITLLMSLNLLGMDPASKKRPPEKELPTKRPKKPLNRKENIKIYLGFDGARLKNIGLHQTFQLTVSAPGLFPSIRDVVAVNSYNQELTKCLSPKLNHDKILSFFTKKIRYEDSTQADVTFYCKGISKEENNIGCSSTKIPSVKLKITLGYEKDNQRHELEIFSDRFFVQCSRITEHEAPLDGEVESMINKFFQFGKDNGLDQ